MIWINWERCVLDSTFRATHSNSDALSSATHVCPSCNPSSCHQILFLVVRQAEEQSRRLVCTDSPINVTCSPSGVNRLHLASSHQNTSRHRTPSRHLQSTRHRARTRIANPPESTAISVIRRSSNASSHSVALPPMVLLLILSREKIPPLKLLLLQTLVV